MSPTTARRLLLLTLVGVSGCTALHAPRKTHAPLPALHVAVASAQALQPVCIGIDRGQRYGTYFGCVERDYANNVCVIYTEPNPPRWILAAEQEHCDGGSHE
jgi:hypothetical protein